jgi:hypothetical protein
MKKLFDPYDLMEKPTKTFVERLKAVDKELHDLIRTPEYSALTLSGTLDSEFYLGGIIASLRIVVANHEALETAIAKYNTPTQTLEDNKPYVQQ